MWGPSNALYDEHSTNDQQGLTPRVFELLFARINEVRIKCYFLLNLLLWCSLLCFLIRSKLSILASNSCIGAAVLSLRLKLLIISFHVLCPDCLDLWSSLFDAQICYADIQRANNRSVRPESKKSTGKLKPL